MFTDDSFEKKGFDAETFEESFITTDMSPSYIDVVVTDDMGISFEGRLYGTMKENHSGAKKGLISYDPSTGNVIYYHKGMEFVGDVENSDMDYDAESHDKTMKCFICSKPANNQRGVNIKTQPSLANKDGDIWLCDEHNNLFDFGLFANGNLLAWRHPNGTKYLDWGEFGRKLKNAESVIIHGTKEGKKAKPIAHKISVEEKDGFVPNRINIPSQLNPPYTVESYHLKTGDFENHAESENGDYEHECMDCGEGIENENDALKMGYEMLCYSCQHEYTDEELDEALKSYEAETFDAEEPACGECGSSEYSDDLFIYEGGIFCDDCITPDQRDAWHKENASYNPDSYGEEELIAWGYKKGRDFNAEEPVMWDEWVGEQCNNCKKGPMLEVVEIDKESGEENYAEKCKSCGYQTPFYAESFEAKGIDTLAEPFEEMGISKPYARLGVIAAGITALAFGVNKIRK